MWTPLVRIQVLCYHGPLLYEAKCTKIRKESNQYQYFIHYQVRPVSQCEATFINTFKGTDWWMNI